MPKSFYRNEFGKLIITLEYPSIVRPNWLLKKLELFLLVKIKYVHEFSRKLTITLEYCSVTWQNIAAGTQPTRRTEKLIVKIFYICESFSTNTIMVKENLQMSDFSSCKK